ncbi:MAG TPA: FAD-dependent oxidoreductase [Bryobacteraceae bacterium]|nr:FAD-dependent oxidoreductase [Bryobacteraceae bacterium]
MAGEIETTCGIVGGGPAGMMLGYLLARKGVPVTVLEKHRDFNRDFRGDTVHPSTLEIFGELGLLDDLLKRPHQKLTSVGGVFGDFRFQAARFEHLPVRCRFVALMPQWDFLSFLAEQARLLPSFDLRMQHEATGLLFDGDRVAGVAARSLDGPLGIRARLVVGCDGRHSVTRQAGRLERVEYGVPIDVLWFRISRRPDDPDDLFGNINYGRVLVLINRGDYFQAGLLIEKGSFDSIRGRGLEDFRRTILEIAPYLGARVDEIRDWEQVKLLTVVIDRLRRWHRPGLLCIGDAAHAMSPAGGVGINLAVQDAVAAANILGPALRDSLPADALLERVQRRREFPVRAVQTAQMYAHQAFAAIFRNPGPAQAPLALKVATRVPGLQNAMGRFVGMGLRPEHVAPPKQPCGTFAALMAGVAAAAAAWAVVSACRAFGKRRLGWLA